MGYYQYLILFLFKRDTMKTFFLMLKTGNFLTEFLLNDSIMYHSH